MFSRLGLRFRMAASYVAVSAAAVLLVELILLTFVAPLVREAADNTARAEDKAVKAKVEAGASKTAAGLSILAADLVARQQWKSDAQLLSAVAGQGSLKTSASEKHPDGKVGLSSPVGPLEALATPGGQVVESSAPKQLPPGSALPAAARGTAPRSGSAASGVWATAQVRTPDERVIGIVYLRAAPDTKPTDSKPTPTGFNGLLTPGLVVLALLVPVGLLFGLLSTGTLIRRIRRLADSTQSLAAGDLRTRVPVRTGDEVGQLEAGFNWMAQRLEAAVQVERATADVKARRAERTRIARELHDSVSQDLFSLNLLAAGLRRALPPESELRHQAESMERTVDRTMREMRAMLLELRPVALEDAGLVAALDELCRAYETRLGVRILADIGQLRVEPAIELAVLRVAQEALGNATRHGKAEVIELSLTEIEGHIVLAIADQGRGFDPARIADRHGMGLELMRERVTELGGTLDIASAPRQGTTVRVRIPGAVG